MRKTFKALTSLVLAAGMMVPMALATGVHETTAAPLPETGVHETTAAPLPETGAEKLPAVYTEFVAQYGAENLPAVYYNGTAIAFEDTLPLIKEGTTFVPIRAFTDTIGAEIAHVAETNSVLITNEGEEISFVVGSNEIKVGEEIVTLAAATFALNDRTYVPVRLIAEAFDLEVVWNQAFLEVSIMDIEALKEGIDTDYKVLDGLLGMENAETMNTNYFVEDSFNVELTMDGKTVAVKTESSGLANVKSQSYDMTFAVDLSDFEVEIKAILAELAANPEALAMVETVLAMLEDINVEFIMDMETFDIYLRSNLFDYLGAALGTDAINKDTWLKITYKDLLPEAQYNEMMAMMDELTSGDVVMNTEYMVDLMLYSYRTMPISMVNYYEGIQVILDFIADDNFVKTGFTYVLEGTGPEAAELALDYNLTVKMGADGIADSFSFDFAVEADGIAMEVNVDQPDAKKATITMDFDFVDASVGALHMEYAFKLGESREKPTAVPTENVFDIMDIAV